MQILYREVRQWPGNKTPQQRRQRAPFKARADVFGELFRELKRLGAARATVSGFWQSRDLKRDGGPYADARPKEPGIIVEFERSAQQYRFATDRFPAWQDNLHAICLVLEGVRRMERYGVNSSQLLEGFRALPAQAGQAVMSEQEAADLLADRDPVIAAAILVDRRLVKVYEQVAMKKAHPDQGGSDHAFVRVKEAVRVLTAGHES